MSIIGVTACAEAVLEEGLRWDDRPVDLTTFYAIVSGTCFALVGLWWNVLSRREQLTATPEARRLSGAVYLSFLLPALMGMFAQVAPSSPLVWRSTFALVATFGAWSTAGLIRLDRSVAHPGPFRRLRWLVVVLYALIVALAVVPDLAGALGLSALQGAAIALILLIVLAHGLVWEFMVDRGDEAG